MSFTDVPSGLDSSMSFAECARPCVPVVYPPVDMSGVFSTIEDAELKAKCVSGYYAAYASYCDAVTGASAGFSSVGSRAAATPDLRLGVQGTCVSDSSCSASVAGSSLPGSASSVVSGRTVSSAGRRSAARAAAWRAKLVKSNAYPEGHCYGRMVKTSALEYVGSRLLQWPTVSDLLSQESDLFHSLCLMDGFRLTRRSGGYHVVKSAHNAPGEVTWSLNDSFTVLARAKEFPLGSLGASYSTRVVRGDVNEDACSLDLTDCIGGSGDAQVDFVLSPGTALSAVDPAIYLAGADQAIDWGFENFLPMVDFRCTVYSPRNPLSYSAGNSRRLSNLEFRKKKSWEIDNINKSDCVLYHFTSESSFSDLLTVLNLVHDAGKLVVSCSLDSTGFATLDVCKQRGVPVFRDLHKAYECIRDRLTAASRGSRLSSRVVGESRWTALAPSSRTSEASGSSKRYCKHWLHKGTCEFESVGCRFLHQMPQLESVRRAYGLRDYPSWWLADRAELRRKSSMSSFCTTDSSLLSDSDVAAADAGFREELSSLNAKFDRLSEVVDQLLQLVDSSSSSAASPGGVSLRTPVQGDFSKSLGGPR